MFDLAAVGSKALEQRSLEELVQIGTALWAIHNKTGCGIGLICLEARKRFSSNQEFGKWRATTFSGMGSKDAGRYVAIAQKFNGTAIGTLPATVQFKLATAAKEIVQGVEQAVKDGVKVTQRVVEAIIRTARGPEDIASRGALNRTTESQPVVIKGAAQSAPISRLTTEDVRRYVEEEAKAKGMTARLASKPSYQEAEVLRFFGLSPLTEETAQAVARYYASKHHPDKGGSQELSAKVNTMRDVLINIARRFQ